MRFKTRSQRISAVSFLPRPLIDAIRHRQILVLISLGLPLAWVTACQTKQPTSDGRQTETPRHHWIQNDELVLVMKKLEANTTKHWPSTLPDDPEASLTDEERREAFRNAEILASALSQSAVAMQERASGFGLLEADRLTFTRSAGALSDQARELVRAARRHNIEGMHQQLDAIRASCISCHTRFKDIAGDLPPRA